MCYYTHSIILHYVYFYIGIVLFISLIISALTGKKLSKLEDSIMSEEKNKQSRTGRKKDKMRQQIITVAFELFRKQGFNATTMEQIAEKADIAKKTLYNYFSEKEAILSAYIQGYFEELDISLAELLTAYPDVRSRLLALFALSAEIYETDPEFLKVYIAYRVRKMFDPGKEMQLRSGVEELLTTILLEAQKTGQIRKDIPAKELARYLKMSYFMTIMDWLTNHEHMSLNEGFNCCVDIFLNGATV